MSSFERKQYVSLSHAAEQGDEPQQLHRPHGRQLPGGRHAARPSAGAVLTAPRRPDGARPRLRAHPRRRQRAAARVLRAHPATSWSRPGTPTSASRRPRTARTPGSATRIERIAGATTDLQHIVHQGMTHYDATFWVGANAILRKQRPRRHRRDRLRGQLGDPPLHPGPHGHRGHRVDHRPRHPRLDAAQLPRAAGLQRHAARLRLAVHPAPALGQRWPADPAQAARAVAGPPARGDEEPLRRAVPPRQLHGVDLLGVGCAC